MGGGCFVKKLSTDPGVYRRETRSLEGSATLPGGLYAACRRAEAERPRVVSLFLKNRFNSNMVRLRKDQNRECGRGEAPLATRGNQEARFVPCATSVGGNSLRGEGFLVCPLKRFPHVKTASLFRRSLRGPAVRRPRRGCVRCRFRVVERNVSEVPSFDAGPGKPAYRRGVSGLYGVPRLQRHAQGLRQERARKGEVLSCKQEKG